MTLEEIKSTLDSPAYSFLKTNEHLGSNIIILTVGGSYAYGTDTPDSDLDIRGCALNSKREILTNENFEQFTNDETDTTIYSFNKLVSLLSACNPNTIEMLGNRPEHYFYISPIGQELIDNVKLFLSQRAIYSFGGYSEQQLARLNNKAVRLVPQPENEQHILNTIKNAEHIYKERFFPTADDEIKLYIDKSTGDDLEAEIFMDINLKHYPLRDYKGMWSEMHNIVKSFAKIGSRNQKAIEHGKIAKHMMHLIRLYIMCLDILEKEQVITYRADEHDLLMDIRSGKYLDRNSQPIPEFWEMLEQYKARFEYAKGNTSLPKTPDYKKINDFVESVNERVVNGIV